MLLTKLTGPEKRYISLLANKMSSKKSAEGGKLEKHFQLFDLLNNLIKEATKKTGDEFEAHLQVREKQERKKAKGGLFATINVKRLTEFIYDGLRQYHADQLGYRISNQIQTIRILFSKKLYAEAYQIIQEAKHDILEHEPRGSDLFLLELNHIGISRGRRLPGR